MTRLPMKAQKGGCELAARAGVLFARRERDGLGEQFDIRYSAPNEHGPLLLSASPFSSRERAMRAHDADAEMMAIVAGRPDETG
jgi:hypothetical protein